ncbi:triggering receptor expressed on myeloid cells 1-like isoform X1 [Saccopteryx bilineata]|uniref:triggering receptor expressed on myeloid cells 1-like isoform X1 n=1 Tax=Saccopteryx bilineata TaxID=59482 RepID=UPI00338F3194
MRKTRLPGLLWMAFIIELRVAATSEEVYHRTEGQTLIVECPFTVWKYPNSRKAWQRLTDGGKVQTLAETEGTSRNTTEIQVGKYLLQDIPIDGMLRVKMTDLRVEDSGLYQCVLYQPPKDPLVLFHPVRLVVTKDPASDNKPTQSVAQTSTLPPIITTKAQRKLQTSPRTVTKLLLMPTASFSSPGPGVNTTHGTDVIGVSVTGILTIVVCGILSKSLVFTALLVVTQRTLGR